MARGRWGRTHAIGVRITCDGCETETPLDAMVQVGRVQDHWLCAHCLPLWRAVEAAEDAERLSAVEAFEAARSRIRAEARKTLKSLPDEP